MSTVHFLKTWREYFAAVVDGRKKCEVRWDDRDYRVGDVLILCEHDPEETDIDPWTSEVTQGRNTGRQYRVIVTEVRLPGPLLPLPVGYVLMSIELDGWRSENPWEHVNRLEGAAADGAL